MPYLNVDPNYPDHPKTRRLIIILGEMADCLPIRLWSYCAKYHPKDGRMPGYSAEEIEGAVLRWRGTPGKALEAMKIVGFIFSGKNGYGCVDWHQHQGHLETFSRRGKVAAKARWNKYASSMHQACLSNAPSYPIHTIPNLTNLTTTDVKKQTTATTCSELGQSPTSEPQKDDVFLIFPCNGQGLKQWSLAKSKVVEWAEAFPAVDIEQELYAARQWCADNPKRRKTPQGMLRFLSAWLSRAQNRGQKNA